MIYRDKKERDFPFFWFTPQVTAMVEGEQFQIRRLECLPRGYRDPSSHLRWTVNGVAGTQTSAHMALQARAECTMAWIWLPEVFLICCFDFKSVILTSDDVDEATLHCCCVL